MGAIAVCTIECSMHHSHTILCVDPVHHLHIDKIARGGHLHVTPNPKHSIIIAKMDGTMYVIINHEYQLRNDERMDIYHFM